MCFTHLAAFFGTPENATRTRHHQGDRYSQQHCRFHLTTPLNAKYNAVMLAASRVGDEYDKRVNQAWAARDVAFEKYYLARYGKKPYE